MATETALVVDGDRRTSWDRRIDKTYSKFRYFSHRKFAGRVGIKFRRVLKRPTFKD